MSDTRLSEEAARRRRQLREEQARHAVTRAALREANRMLLRFVLRDLLADPSDFGIYTGGLDAVMDDAGRLVWSRIDRLVDELLREKPHLAVRQRPPVSRDAAVSWNPTEAHQSEASDHGGQGPTRADQGSAGSDHRITEPLHD